MTGGSADEAELEYMPSTQVRIMPPPPGGGRPALSAVALADLGAMAGAHGLERGAVTKLLNLVQTNSAQTAIALMPHLFELIKDANHARINRITQAIRVLPQVPVPQPTGVRAMLGVAPLLPQQAYVSLDAVIAILAAAQVENPAT